MKFFNKYHLTNNQLIEIAEIAGLFTGDGWIESNESALYITGNSTEDKDYYDNFLSPLFSKYFCPVQPKYFPYWSVYGIVTYKKEGIQKALGFNFQKGKKTYIAEMPSWIYSHNNVQVPLHFIRGLFDADGCFWCERSRAPTSILWKRTHRYQPQICISSCSLTLIKQVKEFLDKVCIQSRLKIKNAAYKNNRNNAASYMLLVRKKEHILLWFAKIGSNNPKHLTKFAFWKKYGHLPANITIQQRLKLLEEVK